MSVPKFGFFCKTNSLQEPFFLVCQANLVARPARTGTRSRDGSQFIFVVCVARFFFMKNGLWNSILERGDDSNGSTWRWSTFYGVRFVGFVSFFVLFFQTLGARFSFISLWRRGLSEMATSLESQAAVPAAGSQKNGRQNCSFFSFWQFFFFSLSCFIRTLR